MKREQLSKSFFERLMSFRHEVRPGQKAIVTHEDRLKVAQQVADILYSSFPGVIERVILYGSTVKGTDTPKSDVDILVTLKGMPPRINEVYKEIIIPLKEAGIPLADPKLNRKFRRGKVSIEMIPEVVYQAPYRYIDQDSDPFGEAEFYLNTRKYGRELISST